MLRCSFNQFRLVLPSQSCAAVLWWFGAAGQVCHVATQTVVQSTAGVRCDKWDAAGEVVLCLTGGLLVVLNWVHVKNCPTGLHLLFSKVLYWEHYWKASLYCADGVICLDNTRMYVLCFKPQRCQSLQRKRWQKKRRKMSPNKSLWRMRVMWTSRKSFLESMMSTPNLHIMKTLKSACSFGWKRYSIQSRISLFMRALEKYILKTMGCCFTPFVFLLPCCSSSIISANNASNVCHQLCTPPEREWNMQCKMFQKRCRLDWFVYLCWSFANKLHLVLSAEAACSSDRILLPLSKLQGILQSSFTTVRQLEGKNQ